jgi:hypothetical protein
MEESEERGGATEIFFQKIFSRPFLGLSAKLQLNTFLQRKG